MKIAIRHRIKGFIQEELASLLDTLDRIVKAINDNPYTDYEDTVIVTPSIGTEFVVTLSKLNKTPTGYHIIKKDKACDVYESSTYKWSKNLMYVKATAVSATLTMRIT